MGVISFMVGVNDMTVLVELAKSVWPGAIPLREESDQHPICFNRLLNTVWNVGGSSQTRQRRLHTLRKKLENNGFIYWNKENDMIILTGKGWEVVDGKK